ncbi:hypothetical protein BS330_29130 [Amycolatopsis keratiniphila subsp. nogabecina]|nr:hypothetical protein BS330_29130 [Amycolatopsis keratiniphila subsp. nogabecina]
MPEHATDPGAAVIQAATELRPRPGGAARGDLLEELGLDSVDRVALAVAIEHATGQAIPDHVLLAARTFGDLIDHLATTPEGTP